MGFKHLDFRLFSDRLDPGPSGRGRLRVNLCPDERFAMILVHPDQARLYCQGAMSEAEGHQIAGGMAAVFSGASPDRGSPNEDSAALIPFDATSGVLVVADGMGGTRGGEQASALAVKALRESLAAAARTGVAMRTAILDGIESASQAVSALGGGAATTLAAVEVQGDSVRPYHVGDSIILVMGQRGKIKLQTVSHSPVGFAVEAGVLDAAEAMHHEDRHLVSNVLGAPDMRIEVGSSLKLALRDTLLLSSDGLFDNLHTDEVVARLSKGPLASGVRRLTEDCVQRMTRPAEGEPSKPDDLTFVAFRREPR
jgi:serine/threonine protein phosphatase PrpC